MHLLLPAGWLAALAFIATPPAALPPPAGPVLTLQASGGSGGADVTAFVDEVEMVDARAGLVVRGGVANAGFELAAVRGHSYRPADPAWTFRGSAGLAATGSNFGAPAAPGGNQVAFLQSARGEGSGEGGWLEQELPPLPPGIYQVRLRVAQRACCTGTFDQGVRIFLDRELLGVVVPDNDGQFHTYTSSSFSVASPAGPPGPHDPRGPRSPRLYQPDNRGATRP